MSRSARRILLVTDLWSTHPSGPATAVRNLKRELERLGHTVEILEPGRFFTVPFPLYPEVRLPLFARAKVRRLILEGSYDDIHLVTEGLLGWYARGVCKRHGIVFTSALHGRLDLYAETWLGKVAGALVRRLLARFHSASTLTFVLTQAAEDFLHLLGVSHTCIWPLGIDPIFFTRGTCPVSLEMPVFMYFGRVSSEKNIEEFLEADLPGTKLVIGDGPDRKRLEAQYPSARFVGYQRGTQLVSWLACADAFVMPSRTEVFPLVVVESLAAGVPVAAHDVAGPREFIHDGENGYVGENLVSAATRCLALSKDACRKSVRDYTWENSARRFLALLQESHTPLSS